MEWGHCPKCHSKALIMDDIVTPIPRVTAFTISDDIAHLFQTEECSKCGNLVAFLKPVNNIDKDK